MPGATPTYGLPYQSLGDAPNGPTLGQDLAGTVEVELARIDGQLAPGCEIFSDTTAGVGDFVKPTSPPARFHLVRVRGGGAAGGGTVGAGSGTSEGAGGGGGGYVEKWYLDSELAASEPYTVGAGGTGVVGATGNAGGSSTFKGLTASGGSGGDPMTSGTTSQGAARGRGGAASGGDKNVRGGDGGFGRTILGVAIFANFGGASAGGAGITQQADFGASNGNIGSAPGAGGTGSFSSTASFAGGGGVDGEIIIVSFF